MKTKLLLLIVLFWLNTVKAQHYFATNAAHQSVFRAIEVNEDVIKARSKDFEKKAEAKPLMFVNTKKKVSELNRLSNNLSEFIKKIHKEADTERVLHDLLEEGFYERLLFTPDGDLNANGQKLKIKIDSLYHVVRKINIHGLTHLNDFAEDHFNTSKAYFDEYENKISYFKYFFTDKTNYGMMMAMHYLLLDIKIFELLYFQTIMSF